MDTQTTTYDIIFDSNYATSGSSDNPLFQFSDQLQNVVGMSVMWANIPFSYFTIDLLNNEFYLRQNFYQAKDEVLVQHRQLDFVVRLRPGTYDPDSFCAELQRALAQSQITDGVNYRCFMDRSSARLVIYNTRLEGGTRGGINRAFGIQVPADNLSLAQMMGFEPGRWYLPVFRQVFVNGLQLTEECATEDRATEDYPTGRNRMWYLRAPSALNLAFSSVINVHSSLASLPGADARTSHEAPDDKLLKVPLTSNFTSFINFNSYQQTIPLRRCNIDQVSFYLTLPGRTVYAKNCKDIQLLYDAYTIPGAFPGSTRYNDPDLDTYNRPDTSEPEASILAFAAIDPESDIATAPFYSPVRYLPLNGQGFQVCVRFTIDNAINMMN